MPSSAILTNAGLSKIASATPLDQLNVVQLAVGDGAGGYPALTPDMTGLVNEVWRGAVSNPIRDPNNANVLIFEAAIPASAGPFTIREQAIFDEAGDMIAIGQTSVVEKPDPNEAVGVVATMRLHVALSNAEQVDLFYTDTAATHHNSLTNRDDPASHPASSINTDDGSNVQEEIDQIKSSKSQTLEALVAISGGKWVLITDNFANSQLVRRLPIHTFETLSIDGCPFVGPLDCFIRQDGSLRPYVDVPVNEASNKEGKAVSQADKDPWTSINFDTARATCGELNSNSLMISHEIWAMICWNMISQGFQPRGNTEYGRSHSSKNEFGRRTDGRVPDDRNGSARTLTGSGPETWRHDGTIFGIADMVGNVWEWVDGMKMVNGQFIVADYTGQPEAEWSATGVYISETGQFTNVAPSTLNSGIQFWGSMTKASGYAGNERLQRLMIEPIACTSVLGGRFYWNLDGERFPVRGGGWVNASNAGPAALDCRAPRSGAGSSIGFRSAFVS